MQPTPIGLYRAVHRNLAVPLLTFALPTACFACERPLGRFQHLGACLDCWCGFEVLREPVCPICALPRPAPTDLLGPAGGRCARCVIEPSPLTAVRAAVVYDAHARSFLLRAKVGRHRELLGPLGRQLAGAARATGLARGCCAVVPVPSHPWMVLWRGYRPAEMLARALAHAQGLPCQPRRLAIRWRARLVAKRLGAAGRRAAANVFVARGRVPAEPVLLVDDVMTTGGSLEACARALLRAGASEVRALVWARTL